MRKILFLILLAAATVRTQAQDKVLDKYNEVDDVLKSYVTRNKLDHLTEQQRAELDIPGLAELTDRIESVRILSSDKLKASKDLRQRVPKALAREGFEQAMRVRPEGRTAEVTMLRHPERSGVVVFVVTDGPKTSVVCVKGRFD